MNLKQMFLFSGLVAFALFGLVLTVQTFAPGIAGVIKRVDHFPEITLGVLFAAGVLTIYQRLTE